MCVWAGGGVVRERFGNGVWAGERLFIAVVNLNYCQSIMYDKHINSTIKKPQ